MICKDNAIRPPVVYRQTATKPLHLNPNNRANVTASTNAPRIDAQEILDGIVEWVEIESPSNDGQSVNRMVDKVASDEGLGLNMNRTPGRDGFGDIVTFRHREAMDRAF